MWHCSVERRHFIELLQRDPAAVTARAHEGEQWESLRKGDIRVLWPEKPKGGEFPVALMVAEREVEDFFAWTNTYLANWSPITAYFRLFSDGDEIRGDAGISREDKVLLEAASVGLIVAEAIGQSSDGYDVDRVSMSACIATFSYAASQGVRRNAPMQELAREWSTCRSVTGQAPLRIGVESALAPWETVSQMVNGWVGESGGRPKGSKKRLFVDGVREVVDKGEIGESTWKRLTTSFPSARVAIEPMKGTQEERVLVLERVLRERSAQGYRYKEESSFVAGYLASRIFPGTIKHAGLVLRHLENYPSAVLWLGLFAGLHGRRELNLSSLGRHVWRAIVGEESVLSRPNCDIGIRELCVLIEGGMFGPQFRPTTPGRLVVELIPGVNTVVRWPAQEAVGEARRQREMYSNWSSEAGGVLSHLKEIRKGLDDAIGRLERWDDDVFVRSQDARSDLNR